jgi:hypothetical protein
LDGAIDLGSCQQFDLDLANTKGGALSSFGSSSGSGAGSALSSLDALDAIRQTRDTTLRSLEDIVLQGWRSDSEERPSFEQITPVLEVLFRMATRRVAAKEAAGSRPRQKSF